jgi:hypothetical protein
MIMGAAFAAAPGFRNIGSTSMLYIPTLYSGKMLKKYYDTTVLGAVTNTEYENEIKKFGDTVIIRTTPTITVRDYQKGMTLVNEQPESVAITMQIDQGKYWSFVSDDVDKLQSDIKGLVEKWAAEGAEAMKVVLDTNVLAYMAANPHASNAGATAGVKSSAFNLGVTGTPLDLSSVNILDLIVDCGTVLDEQNVPTSGRFMVIPPRVAGAIKKSDLQDASLTGDGKSILREGSLGRIDRFDLFVSNLLPACSDATGAFCPFGHRDATAFATQLVESKMQDNPSGFGTLHRGLQVFGRQVIKPEALGVACIKL